MCWGLGRFLLAGLGRGGGGGWVGGRAWCQARPPPLQTVNGVSCTGTSVCCAFSCGQPSSKGGGRRPCQPTPAPTPLGPPAPPCCPAAALRHPGPTYGLMDGRLAECLSAREAEAPEAVRRSDQGRAPTTRTPRRAESPDSPDPPAVRPAAGKAAAPAGEGARHAGAFDRWALDSRLFEPAQCPPPRNEPTPA